ncbi:hypothetical protein GCM10007049_00610 [Echinicola pacifica]|uniref:Methyltransferase domain-containing protein n=1 Tax=Echinicola pacifica TaxID=346377 RepID=A0A918PLB5_9BACT|nr:hypothetical protein [Echinicola pacifica]GGZ12793.1 hypothetical protein GCM10007049_00610 [Echinicola pacifica]
MNIIKGLRDKLFGLKKIEYLLSKSAELSKNHNLFSMRELKAMEILRPYFPDGYLLETSYSISFQTIQHIINDIILNKPAVILEFGSGLSTQIISNYILKNGLDIKFVSIDNDLIWLGFLQRTIKNVDFYHFPLKKNHPFSHQGNGQWFDIPKQHIVNSFIFDMVIVDAPKGDLGEKSRVGAIEFLSEKLGSNPIVFIDDSNRKDEREICDLLLLRFETLKSVKHFYNYSRLSHSELFYSAPS